MSDLVAAYQAAEYHVLVDPPFVMKVGEYCPGLAKLIATAGAEAAIFITAYNPFSVQQRPEVNEAANAKLRKKLGRDVYPGAGRSPDGDWPEELSYLSLGHEYADEGYALARQFGQNAFLWVDEGCAPRLLISNKALMTEQDIIIEYNLTLGAQWRARHIPRPAPPGSGLDYASFLEKFHSRAL